MSHYSNESSSVSSISGKNMPKERHEKTPPRNTKHNITQHNTTHDRGRSNDPPSSAGMRSVLVALPKLMVGKVGNLRGPLR
jgi:hypothetical protein